MSRDQLIFIILPAAGYLVGVLVTYVGLYLPMMRIKQDYEKRLLKQIKDLINRNIQ